MFPGVLEGLGGDPAGGAEGLAACEERRDGRVEALFVERFDDLDVALVGDGEALDERVDGVGGHRLGVGLEPLLEVGLRGADAVRAFGERGEDGVGDLLVVDDEVREVHGGGPVAGRRAFRHVVRVGGRDAADGPFDGLE